MSVLLFLHVFGAILLVGNIVTAAFWNWRAYGTGNPAVIRHAAKTVMLADFFFTLPGVLLITVSGSLMAERTGGLAAGFNWLTLSLLLFGLTGAIWLGVLLPLQRGLIRHSARIPETGELPREFRRALSGWNAFGTAATLLPVVVLYLMIDKPF